MEQITILDNLTYMVNKRGKHKYVYTPFALGYILYEDGINLGDKVAYDFKSVVRYLLKQI